ncbi:MAG TPA: radical SAM protein [Chroococcales cyanobacterium]
MSEDLRIDSHKLIFHPERVANWLRGENIFPLEAEISLSGACNHRCRFCALEYTEYAPVMLDKDLVLENLAQMRARGLKSVIFAGEGEPLLNKQAPEIFNAAKAMGIDVAMSTNGVLLTEEVSKACLESLTWIRFSVSAAKAETYHSIHRGRPDDLERVLKNLEAAVRIKREGELKATLGVQLLLMPENVNEVFLLAEKLREIGVDYFTVKPFSKHPKSGNDIDPDFHYPDYLEMEQKLKQLETSHYQVFFRSGSMRKCRQERDYDRCWGHPFFTYIDARGNVWPCIAFLGDQTWNFGNIHEGGFVGVWEGERRSKLLERLDELDLGECRQLCRLDEINRYLDALKHPGGHVNFI